MDKKAKLQKKVKKTIKHLNKLIDRFDESIVLEDKLETDFHILHKKVSKKIDTQTKNKGSDTK